MCILQIVSQLSATAFILPPSLFNHGLDMPEGDPEEGKRQRNASPAESDLEEHLSVIVRAYDGYNVVC